MADTSRAFLANRAREFRALVIHNMASDFGLSFEEAEALYERIGAANVDAYIKAKAETPDPWEDDWPGI